MGENLKPSPKNSEAGPSTAAASSSAASATSSGSDQAVVDQLMSLGFSQQQVRPHRQCAI